MLILNGRRKVVRSVEVKLGPNEAIRLIRNLARVLENPEASEEFGVWTKNREFSLGGEIATKRKLKSREWSPFIPKLLEEEWRI